MTRLRLLVRRLTATLRRGRFDQDLRDEIAAHLAEAADEYQRRGMSPADARAAARRSFGGVTQVEQVHRDVRSFTWIDDLRQDLRQTRRSFIRNRGFTLVAILTLALGIGAGTTIFTLLDAVVFKPLPVPHPRELYTFYENAPDATPDLSGGSGRYLRFSYPRFERLQRALGPAGSLAAMTRSVRLIARLPGETQRSFVQGQFVSGSYFSTLGVTAASGRTLTADDARPGQFAPIAVISDSFWRQRFNGSASALGQTMVLNDVAVTVVGIAPPGFFGAWSDSEADAWLPVTLQHPMHYESNRSVYGPIDPDRSSLEQEISWLNLVARIPGGDVRRVMAQLQTANRAGLADLAAAIIDAPKDRASMLSHTLVAEPFAHGFSGLRARYSDALFALSAMVALVLVVTCANIANLLLARAAAQARDISIRLSLGATTSRLLRQALTESLALAAIGGALGIWFSQWSSAMLARQVLGSAGHLPISFAPDARVVAFAAAVSAAAAIVFGLVPAWRTIAAGRRATLGGTERHAIGGGPMRGMPALVVGQLALSLVLVSAAMLLGRTLINFMRIDPGFDTTRLVTVYFDPVSSGYLQPQQPALARRLVASAESVPGVAAAAVSMCGLINGCSWTSTYRVEGAGADERLYGNWITPGYFSTVGIPLAAGRDFRDGDAAAAARIAIVNETVAKKYFPRQTAVGRHLGAGPIEVEIVGVVRDARTQSLHDPAVPMVYMPIAQRPATDRSPLTNLDVRVSGSPASVEAALRAAIRRDEPNLIIGDVGAMSRRLSRDLTRERIVAWLAFAFGMITLLLAALGLYGVLSYAVARRTQEIGVRLALGARRVQILSLVGGQSARLTAAGLTLGLLGAVAGSRYMSGLLFGVSPFDPLTLSAVMMTFVVVTALASYIPARRATRVDPLTALRCE